ncbi:hypothetical protein CC2G_011629 [Coprinopsis cinerea AmutBmut pab1-1]|nr:hypothetical protein CC2G_011629 [Coprinopsis cinerea AmutBmut pab1-1]
MNGTTVDPAIVAAYQSIVCYETNWLLLHYDNDNFDDLVFYAHGCEGLEELKTKIYDLDKVFVAFYREENEPNPGYILINYIPVGISGVKRARALVHSRRMGIVFKKHQTMLTVDSLSQLTSSTIHQALVDPGSFTPPPVAHSFSHTPETSLTNPPPFQSNSATRTTTKKPKPITLDMVRRSFSETYAPHIIPPKRSPPVPPVPPIPASVHKTSGMFVNLLRRMKESDDTPPPTPPKDDIPRYRSRPSPPRRSTTSQNHELPPIPNYSREHSPTGEPDGIRVCLEILKRERNSCYSTTA